MCIRDTLLILVFFSYILFSVSSHYCCVLVLCCHSFMHIILNKYLLNAPYSQVLI